MIKFFYALIFLLTFVSFITASQDQITNSVRHVMLPQDEIAEIAASTDDYVYFGSEVCSLAKDFTVFHLLMSQASMPCENLTSLCERISHGKTTGLATTVEGALNEINEFLNNGSVAMPAEELDRLTQSFSAFYTAIESGGLDIFIEPFDNESQTYRRCHSSKKFCLLRVCYLVVNSLTVRNNARIQGDLTVGGNEIIQGNLFVGGDETIQGDLTVSGTIHASTPVFDGSIELVGQPQQACIIFVDNTLTEKARICSSSIPGDKGVFISVDGGVTQNFRVNNAGGSVIATPSSGIALTVNGGEIIASGNLDVAAGNIILPAANAPGTQGLIQLGGTGATNVVMYEIGTRNLFAGNGLVNSGVTGDDNINIGTSANSTLTTADNTVAIGNSSSAVGTDSIAIGNTANTTFARAIVMGSRDSTSLGVAPTVTNLNGIAIGSANDTRSGAIANGISAIAIGSADSVSTFSGALASGDRSIAIGANATVNAATSIALGSSSGTAGGSGPITGATNSIAIGSANNSLAGANTDNSAAIGSIAIGGSDGIFAGASATGARSLAVGVNATASGDRSLALGSASGTIGGNASLANNTNAIAIGSANTDKSGAVSSGLAAIALGGSDGVFAGASITGDRSIGIGVNANTAQQRAIVIGSASGTAGGDAPTAGANNAIAIGSANADKPGAVSSGIASIALGGSDGVFAGSNVTGDRSIGIGINANAAQLRAIVIGSASGTLGGNAPMAGADNAIAIGGGNSTFPGAISSGLASVSIGGSDGVFAGANITGARSVGIGLNANSTQPQTVVLGSASGTLNGNAPTAGAANAIAIGGANGAFTGANAAGIASIALGGSAGSSTTGAMATGNRSISIGVGATSNFDASVAIGSASLTGGTAPTANNTNAIAIGGANGALAGASASGISAIAIGGASGPASTPTTGAIASGDRSVAVGVNATASGATSIALGSASGAVALTAVGPLANNANSIAIGGGSGALAGASASGVSSVAIGGSNGTLAGATASGARSVAIGASANTAQNDAIVLGNSAATAVRVGIGVSAPTAKLHVIGASGTPVLRFEQFDTDFANAPVWINASTSGTAVNALHINGSNQIFKLGSSRRYKTNIKSVGDESLVIYELNPVLYDAKEGYGEGTNIAGFIAEETFDVAPQLAVLNKDGQPENVAYNSILSLAIKEIQKQQKQLDAQLIVIEDQSKTITNLLSEVEELSQKIGQERARVPDKINTH